MKYEVEIKEMCLTTKNKYIYGRAYIPQSDDKKYKTVILSHGYNSSYMHVEDMANYLAQNGIFAYCYDFCGGSTISKSKGNPLDMSIKTECDDLKDVITMVKKLEYIDTDKLYLYGESQGGFVSALTAAENPNICNGLFLLYPAFCIPDDWKKLCENGVPDTFELMEMTLSSKFYYELPEYDVFERMKNYCNRVEIAHGDADGLVSLDYSKKLNKCFPNSNLVIYPNEGHGFSEPSRIKLREQVLNFVK